jgi:TctA family transporter
MEASFRQSLIMGQGSFGIFFGRPFTAVILSIALFMVLSPLIQLLRVRFRVAKT